MLSRVFAVIEWIEETVLGYMLAAMTGVAFLAVVIRRFFGGEVFGLQPSVWGLELTLYIFLFFILLWFCLHFVFFHHFFALGSRLIYLLLQLLCFINSKRCRHFEE